MREPTLHILVALASDERHGDLVMVS